MAETSEQMNEQADQLQRAISFFKLDTVVEQQQLSNKTEGNGNFEN
jgi:hypothetical protein